MKKEENKNITSTIMRSWPVAIVLMISLILQVLTVTDMLWLGHEENKVKLAKYEGTTVVDFSSKLDFSETMTKAEFAEIYAREHLPQYLMFQFQNGWKSDKEHWAGKQLDFFEDISNMKITNPDSAVNEQMVRVWKTDYEQPSYGIIGRSSILGIQIGERAKNILLIFGIIELLLIISFKFPRIMIGLSSILLTLAGIYAFSTTGKIAIILVTLYIVFMSFKNKTMTVSPETKLLLIFAPVILFIVEGLMFLLVPNLQLNLLYALGMAIPTIGLAVVYVRIWKLLWIPEKEEIANIA